MRDGDCPQTSAKIRLFGCYLQTRVLGASGSDHTNQTEQESVKKTGAVSHLVEASHGLLINSGDVGQTSKG